MPTTLANHADRLNLRKRPAGGLPSLILVTDRHRMPDPIATAANLRRGDAVLLRDYGVPDRAARARALAQFCRCRGLLLFVGGDLRLALAVGAHGIHWPEAALRRGVPRAGRTKPLLVTAAAHSRPALIAAARAGANAALLSPVFATASHPDAPWLGAVRFAGLVHTSPLPVYALGGINVRTAPRLFASGAAGVAAIGGLSPAR